MATAAWSSLASLPSQTIAGPNFGTQTVSAGVFRMSTAPTRAAVLTSADNTVGKAYWVPSNGSTSPAFYAAAPTGTTSTSFVMMGLGSTFQFSTTTGTRVWVNIKGDVYSPSVGCVSGAESSIGLVSNGIPANGAAVTGQVGGGVSTFTCAVANQTGRFEATYIAFGLNTSATYWADIALKSSGGFTTNIINVEVKTLELP